MPWQSELSFSAVEVVILKLLLERAMYGYEILKVVNERTEGAFAWKEGTLYPCLHRLEGAGVIGSVWEDGPRGKPRKYYRLTAKGQTVAQERLAEWAGFARAMQAILAHPA